ncbi:MAG TPA: diguanylate cyclase, partial [Nitrospirota bacterium]
MLIVFISILGLLDMRNETVSTFDVYRRNSKVLVATIEKGLISAMAEGRNEDVQQTLEDIGMQDELLGVRIFDEKGNIIRSSNRGELGGMVDKDTLDEYLKSSDPGYYGTEKGRVLSLIQPIYNSSACFGCHPPNKKINGVLQVKVSLEKAYQDIHENRWFMFKWGILTVLCVCLAQILLMRVLVTMPVNRLQVAMKRAEKGEAVNIDLPGDDALGELARVFRNMLSRITVMSGEAIDREKELVRNQEALKSQALLEDVIEGIPDGVAIMDREMTLKLINPKYKELFPDAEVGQPCYMAIHRRDKPCSHCGVIKVFEDGKIHEHESSAVLADGSFRVVHSVSAPVFGDYGEVVAAVESVRDVTERVTMEKEIKEKSWELERVNKRLAKMAVTDGLTMLFNHRFFQDSLKREFKRLSRHRALPYLSIAMIDIDQFKALNDTYGHQAGDRVLRGISKVLKDSVR